MKYTTKLKTSRNLQKQLMTEIRKLEQGTTQYREMNDSINRDYNGGIFTSKLGNESDWQ